MENTIEYWLEYENLKKLKNYADFHSDDERVKQIEREILLQYCIYA